MDASSVRTALYTVHEASSVIYRLYIPQDFTALYAIEEACFDPPFRFARRYMQHLLSDPDAAAWIAEEDGRMAGFAIAEWAEEPDGVVAYIQTIEVAPEERGHGVGGELLRRIEGSARTAGAQMIWLHVSAENTGAVRLYQANGYLCVGRQEDYYARGLAGLIYWKEIGAG